MTFEGSKTILSKRRLVNATFGQYMTFVLLSTMTIGRKFVEFQPREYLVYACCVESCAQEYHLLYISQF